MAIDRADWHYGGDYPSDLPIENGGTHIGFYLAWVINRDLIGQMHIDDSTGSLEKVKNREMTGRDFLFKECDEKFWDEDLSAEGVEFTKFYYCDGHYYDDLQNALPSDLPTFYHADDSWDNYDRVAELIDQAYQKWKSTSS